MNRPDLAYSVSAPAILKAWRDAGIDWVVTVPDLVQLAVHDRVNQPDSGFRCTFCSNENQALQTAAGLWIGGRRPLVIMQNQGFYNCMNAIRALGLDAGVPLLLQVGQFGREFANLGQDPRQSRRKMVSLLEPTMDAFGMPCFRMESGADLSAIGEAARAAFDGRQPAAILVGHYTGWE